MIPMPARPRERYSSAPRKLFTISLEFCSRSAGISVHVALETPFTMSRNMQKGKYVIFELSADARQEFTDLCVALLALRFPYWYTAEGA